MKKIALSLITFFIVSTTQASIRQYEADLETSNWLLSDNSRLTCTLTHNIPNYGDAKFSSKAARKSNLAFEMDMLLLPDSYGLAEVKSVAPKWRPGVNSRTLAQMQLHKQFSPGLPKKIAWTMLSELNQGMSPTFYYNDWYSENDKVSVALSTAKFKKAYQNFVGCVGNLLNYSFEDISYTILNYQHNSDSLTKISQKRMAMIKQYLSLDPQLDLVLIDAFSDSYGGRDTNYRLSKRRAEKIREYFVASGIDPARIEAKGYGEKRHIASNNTIIGREQNRRVVIRMEQP